MGIEVVVEGLTKSFGKQNIWQDVSLTLPAGEVSVMLGPSGTGKTVFLKSIIGLLKPERGRVLIDGVDMVNSPERDIMETRKLFGLMFQDGALFGSMSLFDNIAFPLREHTRKKESEIRRIVMERIDIVGLLGAEEKLPGRDIRRHAQAGRPRPRARPRPADHPLRRAGLRTRPGPHRLPLAAADRPQRADRRDDAHRHPQPRHRGHRPRQHGHALPPQPRHLRAARGAAHQRRSPSSRSSSPGRREGPIGMSEEKDAATLAAEQPTAARPHRRPARRSYRSWSRPRDCPCGRRVARRRERVWHAGPAAGRRPYGHHEQLHADAWTGGRR